MPYELNSIIKGKYYKYDYQVDNHHVELGATRGVSLSGALSPLPKTLTVTEVLAKVNNLRFKILGRSDSNQGYHEYT